MVTREEGIYRKTYTTAFLSLLLVFLAVMATGEPLDKKQRAEEVKALRFGLFVCWSFSTFSNEEWTRNVKDLRWFNPTGLDTDQWARVAKDAGMNFILFLTKHHDGFCLWDTDTTDWKVTKSPLGKDVLAEVRKSCDKYGLKLALYFSEGDWTWPEMKNPDLKKAQLKELVTQYGPIEFFWMDHAQTDGGLSHAETVAWVQQFQPNCFVGFNHGEPAGEIRLGELGKPGPLEDDSVAPYLDKRGKGFPYLVGELTFPILDKGGRWFYTKPEWDDCVMPAEKIAETYREAVRYGNLFSIDVGPNRDGRLREIDENTLLRVGELIRVGAESAAPAR